MRKGFMMRKRRGVAQALGVFLLMLIMFAALYVPLNYAVQQFESIQVTQFDNNVFDQGTLIFMKTWWVWLPALVFIFGIEYVYLRAQKRGWGE